MYDEPSGPGKSGFSCPNDPTSWSIWEMSTSKGMYKKSLEMYEKALTLNHLRAKSSRKNGRAEKALELIQTLLSN